MTAFLVITAVAGAIAQQSPPRDTTPAAIASGTAIIRGIVVGDDAAGRPIRHARVVLGGLPGGRVAVTDDAGRFAFALLPAGNYLLNISKPAYLTTAYGAARPGRAGTTIVLADTQVTDVTVRLSLGGVVAGALRDARGRPMVTTDVGLMPLPTADRAHPSFASTSTTDDRGEFRLYGIPPGQYYVAAVAGTSFETSMAGRRAEEQNDALIAQLQQRFGGNATATPLSAASKSEPLPLAPGTSFAPIYFPGTARMESATVVTVVSGIERPGVDFTVTPTRTSTIEGTVQGPVQNLDRVELSLMIDGPQFPSFGSSRPILVQAPDDRGRFRYDNVPPGRYLILARAVSGEGDAAVKDQFRGVQSFSTVGGGRSGSGGPLGGTDYVYGRADVDIDAPGNTSVSLTLAPGAIAAGKVIFDRVSAPVPDDLTTVQLTMMATELSSVTISNNTRIGSLFDQILPGQVRQDATWQTRGIPPGPFNLRANLPAPMAKDWWLRSAILNGRDLLDGSINVTPGMDLSGIAFTLTDKHSELSGTLTTAVGKPATDYFVIVAPVDLKLWMPGSRRVKSLRPGTNGSFSVKDLPAGDYFIAAVTDVAPNEPNDPQWLAMVAPAGVPITITDGAKTVQDLRVGGSVH